MRRRLLLLAAGSLAVLSLAAPSAFAHTGLDTDCSIALSQPAPDVTLHAEYLPAFREVFERGDRHAVPKDEAAASKALCGDEGCPGGGVYVEYRTGMAIHGMIFPYDGDGLWTIADLGWIGGAPACNIGEPVVQHVGENLYLVTLEERAGDVSPGADEYCANATEATSQLLLDLKTKQWLVIASNVGTSKLTVEGDRVRIAACDGLKLDLTLDLLREGKGTVAGSAGSGTAAAKAVAIGRKLTKKKDWAGAIAAFNQALAADPATAADPGTATVWSGLGYAQLGKGDLDDADWSFQKALAEGGPDKFKAMVWYNRGLIAEKKKDKPAAKMAFENAHLLLPTKATAKKLKVKWVAPR